MVKEYQERMQDRSIVVSEQNTIEEMTTFIKHTTSAGNIRYAADGNANDDTVMSIVNMTSIFGKSEFKQLIEEVLNDLSKSLKDFIDETLKSIEYIEAPDYTQMHEIRKRKLSYTKRMMEARKGWGLN